MFNDKKYNCFEYIDMILEDNLLTLFRSMQQDMFK